MSNPIIKFIQLHRYIFMINQLEETAEEDQDI